VAAVGGKLGGVGAAAGVLVLRRWLTMSRGAAGERGIFFLMFLEIFVEGHV
jgi:hypothetical protein